jgi:dipeptidyl aminopeptidase/acylaminoacyl peptidase
MPRLVNHVTRWSLGLAGAALSASLLLSGAGAAEPAAAPVAAPAGAAPTAPPQRPITVEDLSRLRDVDDPRISPDGAWVAYTVSTRNLQADRIQADLWMTSWDGATTVQLTHTSRESESSPRWSPDGKYLAFLSGRGDEGEAEQLWLLPRAGGEAFRLTESKAGITDYAWSPDGTRLVLVMKDEEAAGAEAGKEKVPPPIVIDRLYFKEDVTGYLTRARQHLHLLDLATRRIEALTRGDQDDLNPAWSPDGRTLAFTSKRGADADRSNSWEVHLVEARAGAEVRALTRFEGKVNNPGEEGATNRIAWSPDGTQIAFLQGGPPRLLYYAPKRLATVPAAGGPVRVLTEGLDRWVSSLAWASDGGAIYVIVEEDRAQQLVRVPAAGGPPEIMLAGRRSINGYDVGPGGRLVVLAATGATFPEVQALERGALRPLTRQNEALLAELRLGAMEETSFRSKDGTVIHGLMVKPPDFKEGTRYPTILQLHGGPVGQYTWQVDQSYDPCWQFLAASGYVVLLPNPRGSLGRSGAFAAAIRADWGHKDAEDVLAAVDDAVARGVADPARLGIGGWSYGGILTNYVISQDARFKAAISGAGMGNMLAGYGTDMYLREWEAELGTPWTSAATWLKLSAPFLHADRIVTPTLFMVGEKDFNVPPAGSEQMYQALRSLGRDTRLVIYPGQFHGLTRPSYIVDRVRRYLEWYDQHLK